MAERAKNPEDQVAIGQVNAAKSCIKSGDGPKAMGFLAAARKFAMPVAIDIGAALIVETFSKAFIA